MTRQRRAQRTSSESPFLHYLPQPSGARTPTHTFYRWRYYTLFFPTDPSAERSIFTRHKLQATVEEILIIMAVTDSFTTPPHRQNRQRLRPGSRSRRTEAKFIITATKATPPHLHHDFDQCWQRWKVRQAKEETQPGMDKLQQEQERQRLFGGDGDDDGSLCIAMLDVVVRLFGDIDYTDP